MTQTAQTPLALDTPFSGTFAGSGQPQLFVVNVPSAAPMVLQLTDSATADHVELYASSARRRPGKITAMEPTAPVRRKASSSPAPRAARGTCWCMPSRWPAPGSFTLQVNATPVVVTAVTPVAVCDERRRDLDPDRGGLLDHDIGGAGGLGRYDDVSGQQRFFRHILAAHRDRQPGRSTAGHLFDPSHERQRRQRYPAGRLHRDGRRAGQPPDSVDPAGRYWTPYLVHLLRRVFQYWHGRHARAVILLESSVADDLPLFTLDKSRVVSGFWTSAIPQGYSNTVEILASGKVPGLLEPGESVTVPVYYAGMQLPWNLERVAVQVRPAHFHHDRHGQRRLDQPAIHLAAGGHLERRLVAGLSEPGIAACAARTSCLSGGLVRSRYSRSRYCSNRTR